MLKPQQVPEPLRVPWVPLAQLAEGPPGLAEFRRLPLSRLLGAMSSKSQHWALATPL